MTMMMTMRTMMTMMGVGTMMTEILTIMLRTEIVGTEMIMIMKWELQR